MKRLYLVILVVIVIFVIAFASYKINLMANRSTSDETIALEIPNPNIVMGDYDESVFLLSEFIELSIKKPGTFSQYEKYYHPESYILGSDIMKTVVIPNETDKAWKIETVEMIYENLNPESTEKEDFLKVVTEFNAIARISMLDDFAYSIEEEAYQITFYLAQYNGNWLIYDMSEPEFPVMTLDNALTEYEEITRNVDGTNLSKFIQELREYKKASY